jgi:hypothetical protein
MAWNKHQQEPAAAAATESTPLMPTTSTKLISKDGLELSEEDSIVIAVVPQFHSLSEDVIDTMKLGVPIFIAMLSWVGVSLATGNKII